MEVNVLIHKPLGALRPVRPIAAKEKDKHTYAGCEVRSWFLGTAQGHNFRPYGPLKFETRIYLSVPCAVRTSAPV